MYSIRTRKTANGAESYQITVKIVGYNGKAVQKSTSWKPNYKMSEKQLQLALNRVAVEFEKKIEAEFAGRQAPIATENTFFNDFAQYWLSQIEKRHSEAYYASANNAVNKIAPLMKDYRLKDLTPTVLDDIHKRIDDMIKTEYVVTAKSTLAEAVKKAARYKTVFCRNNNVSVQTLKAALQMRHICYASACLIAQGVNMDVEEVFNVQVRQVPYKSVYTEGMKQAIRNTLAEAAKLGIVKRNYARKLYITTKHPDSVKVSSMSIADAQKLMQTCNRLDIRKKLIITFLLFTGARKGEVCGLDWDDIDLENKTVFIQRQYEAVSKKGLILKAPKTKSSIRKVELPDALIETIKEYRLWYENKRIEVGDKWQGENNVLVAQNGKRLHPTTVRNWLDEALLLAGLPHCSVHSLRHTNISILIAAGVSPVAVASRVGHSKTSTTMDIYADFLGSSDREASGKLNDYFAMDSAQRKTNNE